MLSVRKRDGRVVEFDITKISDVIYKAAKAIGGKDARAACTIAENVVSELIRRGDGEVSCGNGSAMIFDIETIQNQVERSLIKFGYADTAKAYILYREQRKRSRDNNALTGITVTLFNEYINTGLGVEMGNTRGQIADGPGINANEGRSISTLNHHVREKFTKQYWLWEIYPPEIRNLHMSGGMQIHDLGFMGPYCAGWDTERVVAEGVMLGPLVCRPAQHLGSFLTQIVNVTFTLQGEFAGAQAWNSLDYWAAGYILKDGLKYNDVRQCVQSFVYNLNTPTRVGYQVPFSNIGLDVRCLANDLYPGRTVPGGHATGPWSYGLIESPVTGNPVAGNPVAGNPVAGNPVAGNPVAGSPVAGSPIAGSCATGYQAAMDMFNKALCAVLDEQAFTFPIPTIPVTEGDDFGTLDYPPMLDTWYRMAGKWGSPYFANYLIPGRNLNETRSMCCRLNLDISKLTGGRGGLFGSNPMTGSIGVVSLNLPRIGYLSRGYEEIDIGNATVPDFRKNLRFVFDQAVASLVLKRKCLEHGIYTGLYPTAERWLRDTKARTGQWFGHHFSTIGLVGLNEFIEQVTGGKEDIQTDAGYAIGIWTMKLLREWLAELDGLWNLEATPAESTASRFAQLDAYRYKFVKPATGEPYTYYTNSCHLPVGSTDNWIAAAKHQSGLQSLFDGGTVFHGYIGEEITSEQVRVAIRALCRNTKLSYVSITPTFQTCAQPCQRGAYISGSSATVCPWCGSEVLTWSRITGYLRPVGRWNSGKKDEFKDRLPYKTIG